jgi:hypothetical protein
MRSYRHRMGKGVYRAGVRHTWMIATLFAIVWGVPLVLDWFGIPTLPAILAQLLLLITWTWFTRSS